MRKRKGNSIAETGVWSAYEYVMKRTPTSVSTKKLRVESPRELAAAFREFAAEESQESLFVVAFDGRNNVIGIQRIYQGTATGTSVALGEIMRSAILLGSVGFAMVHNHPSGDPFASDEDVKLTKDVEAAARLMDLVFLDHLVVAAGGEGYTSIRSNNPSLFVRDN